MLSGLKLKCLRQNKAWIGNTARIFCKYLYNSSPLALSAPSQATCPSKILPAGVTVHVRHFSSTQNPEINEQFLCRRITEGWLREWEGSKRIPKANPPTSVFQPLLGAAREPHTLQRVLQCYPSSFALNLNNFYFFNSPALQEEAE